MLHFNGDEGRILGITRQKLQAWRVKATKICPQLSRRSLGGCRFSGEAGWAGMIQHSHQVMNALRSPFSLIKTSLVRAFRKARALSQLISKISEMIAEMRYRRQRCVVHLSSSILALVIKRLRSSSSSQSFSTFLSISCDHESKSCIVSRVTEENYNQRLQAESSLERE